MEKIGSQKHGHQPGHGISKTDWEFWGSLLSHFQLIRLFVHAKGSKGGISTWLGKLSAGYLEQQPLKI
jgi:hypothetical protein